ncbi:MAG: hypothetical protein QY331_08805 [Melioribacteraceae bacterium]|jgi:hypothetical protein|nr:MAG: hypothetical protein C4543_04145 [Ignavibacteriales bacterium]WKZ68052.1 MAG: hypothetical protein QY331_08805 [Melioribacteraceae bacterium]
MELIPILSLIVLVATISTFILAVGAYILYKIRERKGKTAQAPQPSSIPAELVAPTPVIAEQHTGTGIRRTFEEPYPTRERTGEYQRMPAYEPQRAQGGPEMRPTYVSSPPQSPSSSRYTSASEDRYSTSERKKFMRYTKDGYVEPTTEREKKKKEDQLKWR